MNEKAFFFFFLAYAIQPAQDPDPQDKQPWPGVRSRLLNQFSSSSGRTYLRRQSGFAAERKHQTCATQENGSPALHS